MVVEDPVISTVSMARRFAYRSEPSILFFDRDREEHRDQLQRHEIRSKDPIWECSHHIHQNTVVHFLNFYIMVAFGFKMHLVLMMVRYF